MGNRRISPDLKDAALRMWEAGWAIHDICGALAVSKSSLYRWRTIFDELGTPMKPPCPILGRPRLIGMAALQACKDIYVQNSDTYLTELQWYLAIHHDLPVSISALQAMLDKAGLSRKVLHKIASERDKELRVEQAMFYIRSSNCILTWGCKSACLERFV
ncbi:hypothetical protein D9758_004606 [Tetrapyrgos nigripes]|uniref:Transposase n=1 Tax=Tetrapyrgos nigripes TaxID=182062 RepID=A0A8H5H030_9AGAR|nr:hypothetical protein D9758_004606 [Tetrapyrgos nigripes]